MEPEYREWDIDFGNGYVVLYRHDGEIAVIPVHPSNTLKISFQPERHYFSSKLIQIPA